MNKFGKVVWIMGKSFRFCIKYIFVYVVCIIVPSAVGILLSIVGRDIVNELACSQIGDPRSSYVVLIVLYAFLYVIQRLGGFLSSIGQNFYRLNVSQLFQKIYMWRLYNSSQDDYFKTEFCEKSSFASKGVLTIDSYISLWLQLIFGTIGSLVGTIVLIAIYEPLLLVNVFVVMIATTVVYILVSKRQLELEKKQIKDKRFAGYYRSILSGKATARELRIYKTQDFFFNRWQKRYEKVRKESIDLAIKEDNLDNTLTFVRFSLRIFAIILITLRAFKGRYDTGTFIMLFGLIDTCSNQVFNFVYNMVKGTYKDTKYLCDYYDFITPITNDEIIKILNNNLIQNVENRFGDFRSLKLTNVSYTYPNGSKAAVENVTLTVNRGEVVSILGYNGSGKTTLSKLMIGALAPEKGTIKLNDVAICDNNRRDMFLYFGIAPQEPSKFSLSIRDIVGIGDIRKRNDYQEVKKAYKKAEVIDILSKYPAGDKTIIGKAYDEAGTDLSGGEWQKLVIASAYMGEHDFLLMDEPTASIDPLHEMELIKNLKVNLSGKTAVLISHRVGFARIADRIIMMENGKIVENGSHLELLELNGCYARLFNEQKKLYD